MHLNLPTSYTVDKRKDMEQIMTKILKEVLDRNGILDRQDDIIDEIAQRLAEGGYIHIDRIKLNPEKLMNCVAKVMNELQEDSPLIIEG